MKSFFFMLRKPLKYHHQWEAFFFMVLTILSVLNGQTTVFYLIYFFWWFELIRVLVDRMFSQKNPHAVYETHHKTNFGSNLFLLGIYWVFIVAFFGFIAGAKDTNIILTNMEVLFFKNWFFNGNVLFVLLQRWYLHTTQQPLRIYVGAFNPNTIVLHIAIIIGGFVMFFVVKKYPEIFTPQNRWGSALIVLPFLLLKLGMQYLITSNTIHTQKT